MPEGVTSGIVDSDLFLRRSFADEASYERGHISGKGEREKPPSSLPSPIHHLQSALTVGNAEDRYYGAAIVTSEEPEARPVDPDDDGPGERHTPENRSVSRRGGKATSLSPRGTPPPPLYEYFDVLPDADMI